MANFNPTIITDSGLSLIAKISAESGQMKFTRICTSKASYSIDEAQQLSALKSIEQSTEIDKIEIVNDTAVKVSAVITNKFLESGYYINAIGLYAEDPDLGEILYSITIAKVPDWMQPDSGSGVSSLLIQLITQVSNSSNVKTELNPSVLATIQDLEDLKNSLPASFVNYLGEITDVTNILNNPSYGEYPYEGIISSEVATNIGLPAVEWNIKCFRSSEGSGCQIAFPVYNSSETPKYRIAAKQHLNGSAYSIMWDNWQNFSDNGNADTLDSKHASDFSQIISFGDTPTDTKTAIGMSSKTTTYWCSAWTDYPATLQDGQGMIIAVNYKNYGTSVGVDNIWCRQIFITPHNSKIYQRLISATTVEEWFSISDLGYHFADRTQITSGDLNTITTQGQFVVTQAIAADTLANQPWTSSGYYLDVYRRNADLITQIALRWDGKIALRFLSGETWSNWVLLIDSSIVASSTSSGIVSTRKQHFKGQKLFDDNIWVSNPNIVMGEGAPSADATRAFVFTSSDDSMTNASAYMQNVARAAGNNELYLVLRSLTSKTLIIGLGVKVNADGSNYYTYVTNPAQSTQAALRNISSGTAAATWDSTTSTGTCPPGAWYGQHS